MAPAMWKNAVPLLSFAVGWYGYQFAESHGCISENSRNRLALNSLLVQRSLSNCLPPAVLSSFGWTSEEIQQRIDALSSHSASNQQRLAFQDVLEECEVSEQIHFLEDHLLEEIPFFYLSDVIHSWNRLHRSQYMRQGNNGQSPKGISKSQEVSFESKTLCREIWKKMEQGVVPYDVGVASLAILGSTSQRNRDWLCEVVSPSALIDQYEEFSVGAAERQREGERPIVLLSEVQTATLSLLFSLNRGVRHHFWKWLPSRGARSDPLSIALSKDQWCHHVFPLVSGEAKEWCYSDVAAFGETMSSRFSCPC